MNPIQEAVAYTAGGAATASGIARQAVDGAIKTGDLRATKSGKRWIILREDLLDWLRKCRDQGAIPSRTGGTQKDHERLAELNRARKATA